jgi:hypothetical protein
MPGYSLVPVDYQPNFDGYSLVPVDYDPFAADGVTQQSQIQQAQPQGPPQQQPATGTGQPGVNGPATGNGRGESGGGAGIKRLGAPKVATFRAAMQAPVSLARRARGMLL